MFGTTTLSAPHQITPPGQRRDHLEPLPPKRDFRPAPAVIDVARALQVSTDELLGVRPPRVERIHDDTEARHMVS
jgi:hypothetical protein